MINRDAELSIRRQCELVDVSRSGWYYQPVGTSAEDLDLMRQIDALHLKYPFLGSRQMRRFLAMDGHRVNRKHVQRLMRLMGLQSVAPQPSSTSDPAPEHRRYPYLLRGLAIDRVNQVWCADMTYVPMARGFGYVVAIMDWHSRRVLAWRLSNTMDSSFCVEALEEALSRFEAPEIFNTDQGSQFTANAFTRVLRRERIKISMDGKGRWLDNVFVERLWRSLKYEEVYLHAYEDLSEARIGIGRYFSFYNELRPHTALGDQTPSAFYAWGLARSAA